MAGAEGDGPAAAAGGWLHRLRHRLGGAGRAGASLRPAARPDRWVVLDVEATGLDAHRDRLLAVAAVAVQVPVPMPVSMPAHTPVAGDRADRPAIRLGDAFECVLRAEAADDEALPDAARANILLHGIGLGDRRAGVDRMQAMDALVEWLDGAPVIGFHVAFDATLLQRQRAALGRSPLPNAFVDLEHVAQALMPQAGGRSLDDWMARLGVHCSARHRASADALATAEVLLRLWPAIAREAGGRPVGWETLQRLAAARKWLARAER